ncbi:MAG: sodium:solute symporter family protein [Candidatus Altiarchaeota archaeon]
MIDIIAVTSYLVLLLAIGFLSKKYTTSKPEDYFLASRSFGKVLMLSTMAATNFSAFFFLGFAGAAYKYGFGQYGIMGVGTALMPIMFYVIGRKVWRLGKERGYITPAELVGDRLGSRKLRLLFMAVMVAFTIPYLGVQAIGAGLMLNLVLGISVKVGAVLALTIITFYILLGGMRASSWTDVLQGVLMVLAILAAVFFVSKGLGGFEAANLNAFDRAPELFSRPGGEGYFTMQVWLSFMLLWVFVDPMFPQLFSRFYTARSEESLKFSMIAYPLVIALMFFSVVLIGVWARGIDYEGAPDQVLPYMVKAYAPEWVFALVMVGALAALMSTADSQLLALSTMLSHDLELSNEVWKSRLISFTISMAALAYIILGFDPAAGIFGTLVKTTFSGLVVLFPATYVALYRPKTSALAVGASIILGEVSIVLFQWGWLPTYGFLDGMLALLVSAAAIFVLDPFTRRK